MRLIRFLTPLVQKVLKFQKIQRKIFIWNQYKEATSQLYWHNTFKDIVHDIRKISFCDLEMCLVRPLHPKAMSGGFPCTLHMFFMTLWVWISSFCAVQNLHMKPPEKLSTNPPNPCAARLSATTPCPLQTHQYEECTRLVPLKICRSCRKGSSTFSNPKVLISSVLQTAKYIELSAELEPWGDCLVSSKLDFCGRFRAGYTFRSHLNIELKRL